MSVKRPSRLSQVASSVLIFNPGSEPAPRSTSCTTIVRSGVLFLGAFGGVGWATNASSPLGVTGEITMKMINRTSSTSMSGVTLMFALWPPLGPTTIPMVVLLLLPGRRRRRSWRAVWSCFSLLSEQAEIVNPGGANSVHNFDYAAKVGAHVGFDIHLLVLRIARQAILHFCGEGVRCNLVAAKVNRAVPRNGDQHRVFFVGVLHRCRIVDLSHVDADAFLQHGRDHHEDDQQDQHHVHHGRDVNVRTDFGTFVSLR